MRVHHVGYLVKSISEAKEVFRKLGYSIEQDTVYDQYRNIDICFLINNNERIEPVAPRNSESSPILKLLKKMGNTPYHICYECDDIDKMVKQMVEENGYMLIQEKQPAPAIQNQPVAFLYHVEIGMIELVEVKMEEKQ